LKAATITDDPVKITKPTVGIDVLTSISAETLEDSFVYVHCHFDNLGEEMLIRIWQTTFLIDTTSHTRVKLIHAENISIAPQWTMVPPDAMFHFLLIFSGLPKSCRTFDLVEEISQPGGFCVRNIQRNNADVYHIDI
jgi:hypothetical protein